MHVYAVANAGVDCRNDIGLPSNHETQVADESLVQDRLDRDPVVPAAFGMPLEPDSVVGLRAHLTHPLPDLSRASERPRVGDMSSRRPFNGPGKRATATEVNRTIIPMSPERA